MNGQRVLITGGAGFIGSNVAAHYLRKGCEVVVFDNLSRVGSECNMAWLRRIGEVILVEADIRDFSALRSVMTKRPMSMVIHLAGQVAVTTSVDAPREDFEVNALGTLNLLEAIRAAKTDPILLHASTNKVYGSLDHREVEETERAYRLVELPDGVSETEPLDFHSPYGCSKGAADQYVRDYHRVYGLRSVVFRQSCIYGARQFGVEDQGWIAHFLISAYAGRPITIYGTGKQVRDLLYVDDLVEAYDSAARAIATTAGQVYNLGGGSQNRLSLLEAVDRVERVVGRSVRIEWAEVRPGDQKVFVTDSRKATRDFRWLPRISVDRGLKQLLTWVAGMHVS